MPGYFTNMAPPTMMRGAMNGAMMRGAASGAGRGLGLFSRLGSGLSAIRSLNWGGFINNASKTLGVINQTIPLVKQVGPMVNNMKSMLRVASIFKDETDRKSTRQRNRATSSYSSNSSNSNSSTSYYGHSSLHGKQEENSHLESNQEDHSPTFFIPT